MIPNAFLYGNKLSGIYRFLRWKIASKLPQKTIFYLKGNKLRKLVSTTKLLKLHPPLADNRNLTHNETVKESNKKHNRKMMNLDFKCFQIYFEKT